MNIEPQITQISEDSKSEMTFAQKLDALVRERTSKLRSDQEMGIEPPALNDSDLILDRFSIGELIEFLLIDHLRIWDLEDQFPFLGDTDLAAQKRKMDIIWKKKKPAVLAAINRKMELAVRAGQSLEEQSLKNYAGFDS